MDQPYHWIGVLGCHLDDIDFVWTQYDRNSLAILFILLNRIRSHHPEKRCVTLMSQSLQQRWYEKKDSIIKQLSSDDLSLINRYAKRIHKTRSEIFWLDDEDAPQVYIVDCGFLRMCRNTDEGKRLITEILGPADVFGEIVPGLPPFNTDDYAEIVRDSRIIGIRADIFHQVLEKHPKMMLRLVQIVENRRRAMEKRVYSFLSKDVCARTLELLMDLGQKYGEECSEFPGVSRDLQLTHQEIADLLGVARPTISTLVGDLIKTSVINKHKQFLCLNNLKRMQELAESGIKTLK